MLRPEDLGGGCILLKLFPELPTYSFATLYVYLEIISISISKIWGYY